MDECLNVNWFLFLEDAQENFGRFREDYSLFPPHSSLGNLSPNQYVNRAFNSSYLPVVTGQFSGRRSFFWKHIELSPR